MPRPESQPYATSPRGAGCRRARSAGAGELGTNEIARRTGLNSEHRVPAAGDPVGRPPSSTSPTRGRYRLGLRLRRARQRRARAARLARSSRARTCRARRSDGRERRRSRSPASETHHGRLRAEPAVGRSVAQLGRPSVGHATAAGKVVLAFGDAGHPGFHRWVLYRVERSWILTCFAREVERGPYARLGGGAGEREDESERDRGAGARHLGELVAVIGVQGPRARFDASR